MSDQLHIPAASLSEKTPRYPLDWRLGGPLNQSGLAKKRKLHLVPVMEPLNVHRVAWSLHRLYINRAEVVGRKIGLLTGRRRRLHSGKFHKAYSVPNVCRKNVQRKYRAEYVSRLGRREKCIQDFYCDI